MASIPLVALSAKPPEQQDLLGQYGKAMQLRSLAAQQQMIPGQLQQQQQQIQLGQQELQKGQMGIDATNALNKSYQGAVKVGADGVPQIDAKAISDSLSQAGFGSQVPGVLENINKFNKSTMDIQDAKASLQEKSNNLLGSAAAAIKASNYNPQLAHTLVDTLPPSPQIQAFRAKIDDPVQLKQIVDSALAGSEKQQQAGSAAITADARKESADTGAARFGQELDPNSPLNQTKVKVAGLEQSARVPGEVNAEVQKQQALQKLAPAGLANVKPGLVAPAASAYDKASQDYATAYQASQNMQDFIDSAKSGNKEAVKMVPLQGALEITTAQGVHRINRTEVDQYGGAGSLFDRIQGAIGKGVSGKDIDDSVLNDMAALQKTVSQNAKTLHKNKVDSINKSYGSSFEPMNFEGGAQGGGQSSNGAPTKPPNATHIGVGSVDKKKHYLDASGKDLGLAE